MIDKYMIIDYNYICQEVQKGGFLMEEYGREELEEMGMTNEQYKGMLLDDLEDWEEVLELAKEEDNQKVIAKAEKQIKKINEKLKF